MKTTFSARFVQRMALTTALCAAAFSAAHADDLNIKTMIPGVPQIDAESYILIDYNSGKVLAEQNADARRDPASLTKMMTSYVIGQAMKAGKFKETDLVTIGNDAWATGKPGVQRFIADVPEARHAGSGLSAYPWHQLAVR